MQAVISGRADAFTGDSPIVEYQGKLENGQIQLAGKTTDVGPYGIAFPKGSPLASRLPEAVTQLIKDGTYSKIINTWGLESGAVTESKINAAGHERRGTWRHRGLVNDDVDPAAEELTVVPVRHPLRWVAVAVIALLAAMFVHSSWQQGLAVVLRPRLLHLSRPSSTGSG